MTRAEERKRAAELRAVDVRELIKTSLPGVLPQLTAAHIDQLQRILDAAVINADIEGKGAAIDRQAIRGQIVHSNQNLRNPACVAQRDRVLAQKIIIKPGENAIRLDFQKLLTSDALKTTSDNADEAAYLLVVAEVYEHRGVWLVLDSSAGAMTQQMNPTDPRKWRVRLLLGFKPGALVEEIQTERGSLTRNALLSVSRLGAGYYEWVHQGPTMKALKKALDNVSSQISLGRSEHAWWSVHRTQYHVVSRVSDKLGGADWPNESIWDQPHQMHVQALQLINAGKLMEATKLAQLAALQAGFCAKTVHEYVAATTSGASRAVKVLGVAEVCGKIAEAFLLLRALGQGMIRLLSRKGASGAAGGQRHLPAPAEPVPTPSPGTGGGAPRPGRGGTLVDNTQPPLPPPVPRPVPREMTPIGDAVNRVRQQNGLPPLPERTLAGPLGRATEAQLNRLHDEFLAWLAANPNASLSEKLARLERLNQAEWGSWFPTR